MRLTEETVAIHSVMKFLVAETERRKVTFEQFFGGIVRRAIDEVIDGPRTGRWSMDQLTRTEKSYVGSKIEILLRAEFRSFEKSTNGDSPSCILM